MGKKNFALLAFAMAIFAGACGRDPLLVSSSPGGQAGSGGGSGGAGGGTVILHLPDGGISALIGDSGILGGILDAPRDSLIGQVICGPEAQIGAKCSTDSLGCLLPSLGGACACVSGTYLCPLNTSAGPQTCPQNAATGKSCISPLSVCVGGGANACICGLGSYTCF
jgi:hypothetical protein